MQDATFQKHHQLEPSYHLCSSSSHSERRVTAVAAASGRGRTGLNGSTYRSPFHLQQSLGAGAGGSETSNVITAQHELNTDLCPPNGGAGGTHTDMLSMKGHEGKGLAHRGVSWPSGDEARHAAPTQQEAGIVTDEQLISGSVSIIRPAEKHV